MKKSIQFLVLFSLSGCILAMGCSTYIIDSNPQGLRVTIDNIERGVTPCEYSAMYDQYLDIEVAAPTHFQRKAYEKQKKVTVTRWQYSPLSKSVNTSGGSGMVFFQFAEDERPSKPIPRPTEIVVEAPPKQQRENAREVINEHSEEDVFEDPKEVVKKEKELFKDSLNAYNSYLDDFSGIIEVNKTYRHFSGTTIDKRLHFKVIQVLAKDTVLVSRDAEYIIEGHLCERATFLIHTKHLYADGATLRAGNYRCLGTHTYENKNGDTRTVYVFEEVE